MRLATILDGGEPRVALVHGARCLPLAVPGPGVGSIREIAAGGAEVLGRIRDWASRQPDRAYRPLDGVMLAPAVPDPGAIYTIGDNYRIGDGETDRMPGGTGPDRPLVYGKAVTAVAGHGATLAWDRTLTAAVDAECELGVVIGKVAHDVAPADAMRHVFGYTVIDDVSSRDPWLDGDQWLLGKSMPGFCPVGPWVVTRDELDPANLRLGCTLNDVPIQDGSTTGMRFAIPEVIAHLSRHVLLRPGDLIATGTPARLAGPLGPDRHLHAGDIVTTWIERIGELTTTIA